MRKDITVAAEVRTSRGKNEARRTRRAGQIPAVMYGAFQDPVNIAVSPREILKIVHSDTGYNTIFNLAVQGGESTPANLVTACVKCNQRKGNRTPVETGMHPRLKPRAPGPTVFIRVAAPVVPPAWQQYLLA